MGYFYLPSSSITDLTIDTGENRIIIENRKTETLIDIYIPHSIYSNLVTAHYDGILYVSRLIYIYLVHLFKLININCFVSDTPFKITFEKRLIFLNEKNLFILK